VYVRPDKREDILGFKIRGELVFEYGDEREAPTHIREEIEGKFEAVLTVTDPSTGDLFMFMEIRL
jgi:hypothetical protein